MFIFLLQTIFFFIFGLIFNASDENMLPSFKINTVVYCFVTSCKTLLQILRTLLTTVRLYYTRDDRCFKGSVFWAIIEFRGNIAVKVYSTIELEFAARSKICFEQVYVIAGKCLDIV